MLNDIALDERYNNERSIVKNAFEIALIQAARMNAFITLSPLWRNTGHQNELFVTSFAIVLAKRMHKRFVKVDSLIQADYTYICARAMIAVWQWSTPARGQELKGLRKLADEVKHTMRQTNKERCDEWQVWDVQMFDKYDIDESLGLLMPRSCRQRDKANVRARR